MCCRTMSLSFFLFYVITNYVTTRFLLLIWCGRAPAFKFKKNPWTFRESGCAWPAVFMPDDRGDERSISWMLFRWSGDDPCSFSSLGLAGLPGCSWIGTACSQDLWCMSNDTFVDAKPYWSDKGVLLWVYSERGLLFVCVGPAGEHPDVIAN